MLVLVDTDYLELLKDNVEIKRESGEYNPFTGKRVPVVSLEDIKKLMSLPKDKRQEMLLVLSNKVLWNY